MYEVIQSGWNVSNPCKTLILTHHHCSNLRPHSWDGIWMNKNGRNANAGPADVLDYIKD